MKTIHFLIPKESAAPELFKLFHEFLKKEAPYYFVWSSSGGTSMVHTASESFYPSDRGLQLHSLTVYDSFLKTFDEKKVYILLKKEEEGDYVWGYLKLRSYKQVG